MKRDIRQEIKKLHSQIGSVVCKEDGTLQICYYADKDKIINEVSRYLSMSSLLECFIKIDFIETDAPTFTQNSMSSGFATQNSINKDLEVSASPTPKESQKAIPSLNPDIKRNRFLKWKRK